jgi:hypothetical protein
LNPRASDVEVRGLVFLFTSPVRAVNSIAAVVSLLALKDALVGGKSGWLRPLPTLKSKIAA